MEVVEVRVPAVGLPALLAAIRVASEHSDGIQRVGLAVVIANPCSTPESRETSVSYPTRQYIQIGNEGRRRGGG